MIIIENGDFQITVYNDYIEIEYDSKDLSSYPYGYMTLSKKQLTAILRRMKKPK